MGHRSLSIGEGAAQRVAQAEALRRRILPNPGVGRPDESHPAALQRAEQQIVLAAALIAHGRKRPVGIRQGRAPQQAVATAVIVVDRAGRSRVDAGKEPFQIGPVPGHVRGSACADRTEYDVGVEPGLGLYQGGQPAGRRLLVVVEEGDQRASRPDHGRVAGVGYAGVRLVDIDDGKRRLGRQGHDQVAG